MFSILKIIATLLLIILIICFLRTWQLERSADQKRFVKGTTEHMPEGLYSGSVEVYQGSWLGKSFNSASSTGVNIFKLENGTKVEKYTFETSVSKGIRDKDTNVIKVDYNKSGNPIWLKPILDEIVEVAPGEYLGKLNLRIIYGYPFTVAFFELKKSDVVE